MYKHIKKGKIVATIGPAIDDEEKIRKLICRGVNVFRLNFSHGTHEKHTKRVQMVRKIAKEENVNIGILLDTKGPEIRVGKIKNKFISFNVGDIASIICVKDIIGTKELFSISHRTFHHDAMVGNLILFDDGQLKMKIVKIDKTKGIIKAQVLNKYDLFEGKGMNCPGTPTSLNFISKRDAEDIRLGCKLKVNYIAPSFVRKREDVINLRKLIRDSNGPTDIQIISKIECQEGIDNFNAILEESDGIMIARGDLGVEIPYESVPRYQRSIIKKCLRVGKPVIVATQMLKSMITKPYPTRAEVTDIYWAMHLGADATMLSGETALGVWSEEAVRVMYRVAKRSENDLNFEKLNHQQVTALKEMGNPYYALAERVAGRMRNDHYHCVVVIVENVDPLLLKALSIVKTRFGIVPLLEDERLANNLTLFWGIHPHVVKNIHDYYDIDQIQKVVKLKNQQGGEKVLYIIPDQHEGYTVRTIVF